MAQRNRALFVLIAMMALTLFVHAQDYKPLLGEWNMNSESDGDPIKWTLTLKEAEGKLVAVCATPDGEKPAKNVTFADGVLKFDAPYEDAYYGITLKADGNKLDGTWEGDGNSGKTYGFRK
jgi:hypothetical protein